MIGEQDRVPGCTTGRLIFPEQWRGIFLGAGHFPRGGSTSGGGFPGLDPVQIWVMGISE